MCVFSRLLTGLFFWGVWWRCWVKKGLSLYYCVISQFFFNKHTFISSVVKVEGKDKQPKVETAIPRVSVSDWTLPPPSQRGKIHPSGCSDPASWLGCATPPRDLGPASWFLPWLHSLLLPRPICLPGRTKQQLSLPLLASGACGLNVLHAEQAHAWVGPSETRGKDFRNQTTGYISKLSRSHGCPHGCGHHAHKEETDSISSRSCV